MLERDNTKHGIINFFSNIIGDNFIWLQNNNKQLRKLKSGQNLYIKVKKFETTAK